MEAVQLEVWKLLGNNFQYTVPIYQRRYNWGKKQCMRLYEDILKINKNNVPHFIGAVTYVGDVVPANVDVMPYQIIDGQQRLTTLMLLLAALKNYLTENNMKKKNVTVGKIDQILFNTTAQQKLPDYYKLVLTDTDDGSFKNILDNSKSEESNNIVANFNIFKNKISNDKVDPDKIWSGFRSLTTVSILIKKDGGDNPQEIFESMNSTGLALSNTDLVRNYILMKFDVNVQKTIYKKYWQKMENDSGEDGNLDEFLRNYLMMEQRVFVSKANLYEFFKDHARNKNMGELIEKIYECSKQYKKLIFKDHESDKLNKVIGYILDQDTTIAHSLLLKILVDYANNKITIDDTIIIFLLVDCYLLRCTVCDTGMKAANRMFTELISHIDYKEYVKSIQRVLMLKTAPNLRFPRNDLFREKIIESKLYSNKNICKYMLVRLEHQDNNEVVDGEKLQIEHILPQTITEEWKKHLGDSWEFIHDKFLHTIGNLTLTAHNPEISNLSFEKKKIEYGKSHLKITRELCDYTKWKKDDIIKRAQLFANKALQIWKIPEEVSDTFMFDDDDLSEKEYLDSMEIKELWHKLKNTILESCKNTGFFMIKKQGSIKNYDKNVNICEMIAQKNQIYLIYNTKIEDGIIESSQFIEDISKTSHHYKGDFRSIIISDDDVKKSIPYIIKIYNNKLT
ncbi:MAG: hypothetical protein K8823_786 [Cenarchaeum symbiont of Oopsacas minuta]|nr:hypothetical protein [Cenarchaeum symbiont of Oopsacas minuta]